jgi:threonylcarbamoyladenosine tRNA methylthiotransferase MtaB
MGRGYSTADFKEAVARCRSQIPDIAITTDIMVGFPGETAAEFEASYDLCREAGFAAIHVFPYSARAGTPAADMPGQVEAAIKRNRALLMLELGQESLARFQARFLGRRREVLWEREISPGLWTGRTDNYMRVLAESRHNLSNRLMSVLLHTLKDGHLWGQVD